MPSLDGPLAKLARAEHHLRVLTDRLEAALHDDSLQVDTRIDGEQSALVFYARRLPEVDPRWGLIIGDCVHNARSSLDHLVYELSSVGLGRELTPAEATIPMFPVAEKKRGYDLRRVSLLRKVDADRIEELQPYNGWDESIWGDRPFMPGPPAPIADYIGLLSEIDNLDKHRLIQPAWLSGRLMQPVGARDLGISGMSIADEPLVVDMEIGRWYFEGSPEPLPQDVDPKSFVKLYLSLRKPHFGTGVRRILMNSLIAVRMILEMYEPSIVEGLPPAPLRYWDGPGWING